MKKLICMFMVLLLCGCAQSVQQDSNEYNMEKIDDFFPVIMEDFGKEIGICSACDTFEFYADRNKGIMEYRVDYSSHNSYYIYRAKKADSFEDITSDMDISWENKTDAVDGILSGFTGNGTISLEYFDLKNQPFQGEVWFDSVDNMVYVAVIIGDGDSLTGVKTVFRPGYFTPVNFDSYDQADEFLKNSTSDGAFFYRSEDTGNTSVSREGDGSIRTFTGDDNNYIIRDFYPDGIVRVWTKTTDSETGNFTETSEDTGLENQYSIAEWTKDMQCVYSYGENRITGCSSEIKYDLEGEPVFERFVEEDCIKECHYDGMYGTYKEIRKEDQSESNISFKVKKVDGYNRRYYLTIDNKYYTKVYTYLSEDSIIYTKFEALNKQDGEVVVWYFDGNGNSTDNVVRLDRTVNGVTTTYSHADIPWGTGMYYPPKNPHEFYF